MPNFGIAARETYRPSFFVVEGQLAMMERARQACAEAANRPPIPASANSEVSPAGALSRQIFVFVGLGVAGALNRTTFDAAMRVASQNSGYVPPTPQPVACNRPLAPGG